MKLHVHLARLSSTILALAFVHLSTQCLAQSAPPAPPEVTVAKPITREVVEDDEFIGRFEAVDQVSLRSRVGGYLENINFKDGSLVKQGDTLFIIDQRPFQAALEQAKSQQTTAETTLNFADIQFKRAEKLRESGTVPVATLDERRSEYLSALAAVDGAKAAVTTAVLNLEYTEIKAPISGRIDRRLVSAGNLVQADQTILTTIVSLDPIDFYFDIDERSYLAYARDARQRQASLQEGGGGIDVVVRIGDDATQKHGGKLDFAENRLDAASGTMRLRARLPNPDFILQPGLFGRVNIPGSLPYKGVLVPDEAVAADQDRRVVYVVDAEGTVSMKPVRTGPSLYGYRVVREGLTGDELIVIDGLMRVRPGIKVAAKTVNLPPEKTALAAP